MPRVTNPRTASAVNSWWAPMASLVRQRCPGRPVLVKDGLAGAVPRRRAGLQSVPATRRGSEDSRSASGR